MTTPGNQELVTTFSFKAQLEKLAQITKKITQSFSKITKSSQGFVGSLKAITRSSSIAAASVAALTYMTGKLANKLASPLLELDQISRATDSAAEGLFAMSNGLKAIGANKDSIKALSEYAQDIVGSLKLGFLDPTKAGGLQRIGIGMEDLVGLDVAQVQALIASTVLTRFPDASVRSQIYRNILGIGSGDLGFKITPENIGSLLEGANDTNDALRAAIENAREFNKVMGELGANLAQIGINIANVVLPVVNAVLSLTNKFLGAYNASDIFGSMKNIAMLDPREEMNRLALSARENNITINVASPSEAADVVNGIDGGLDAEVRNSLSETAQMPR